MRRPERLLLAAVLAYGVALRAWDLGSRPFWVDEAESSINALTILDHGVPVDHYLGQPIYENMLTRPWPESAEYEFKDSSYSERGLAIYHGWLPLYAQAASFALAGVEPDRDADAPRVRHSAAQMRRRNVAGRTPAVVFGALFLAAAFFAARAWYGPDAAWAALAAATVVKPAIECARQARYYSATLALGACCALMIGLMVRRGRWRDFLLGAAVLVLLFHTHPLAFLSTCLAGGLTLPLLLRHPRAAAKLAAAGAILAAGSIPWVVLTGLAGSMGYVPKAWSLLGPPDVGAVLRKLGLLPLPAALAVVWLLAAGWLWGRLPDRLTRPFADHRGPFLFMAGWAALGALAFVGLAPASSYFHGRLVLLILVPGLLFGAMLCAAVARVLSPGGRPALAAGLLLLALVPSGQLAFREAGEPAGTPPVYDVIEYLRGLDLPPGTRIYATPNDHLTLTFYTGLPIQDVAPVRKSFLDRYAGEVLILEAGPRYEPLSREEVRRVLAEAGHPLSEAEARHWLPLLATRQEREELRGRVAEVAPAPEPDPAGLDALFHLQRRKTAESLARRLEKEGNPSFHGYRLADYRSWWPIFYYRFVHPEARMGPGLNYAGRVRDARATVLPSGWVLYRCPARAGGGRFQSENARAATHTSEGRRNRTLATVAQWKRYHRRTATSSTASPRSRARPRTSRRSTSPQGT
jgi:hypothetical protein